MKRTFLLLAIAMFAVSAKAQQLTLDIEPHEIKHVAHTLTLRLSNSTADSADVYYTLYDSVGKKVEDGMKTVRIEALTILATKPLSIPALNQWLNIWNVTAIRVKEENE